MNNKIKEFLGDDAVKAVEDNPQIAMRLLCKEMGWQIETYAAQYVKAPIFNYKPTLTTLSEQLNLLQKVELAVIQKCGTGKYGKWLLHLFEEKYLTTPIMERRFLYEWFEVVATADAKTRCAAMLLALSEAEVEDQLPPHK